MMYVQVNSSACAASRSAGAEPGDVRDGHAVDLQVDGVTVANITRLGSPPSPLPLDPADRRTEFTCTYIITTGVS